ncbi:MAG: hypothetical protein LBB10_02770 [Bifidobacteriaceae bacterium]|jgi:hypothetical protein|nr:hypothetical protein [Bifidobacteriaceae bacterium]
MIAKVNFITNDERLKLLSSKSEEYIREATGNPEFFVYSIQQLESCLFNEAEALIRDIEAYNQKTAKSPADKLKLINGNCSKNKYIHHNKTHFKIFVWVIVQYKNKEYKIQLFSNDNTKDYVNAEIGKITIADDSTQLDTDFCLWEYPLYWKYNSKWGYEAVIFRLIDWHAELNKRN